jgi:UDP-N-acetylmuramyl pentapeptide phosphotransferase/UDP-N-acetylglucosamine-1-phosphate transferase
MFLIPALIFLSFILTYIIRQIAIRHKVLDIPNERSSHSIPTPRGGGLAIVISWYMGITILYFFKQLERELYFALLTGILLAAISLLDDLISLKPVIRLVAQLVTAIVAFYFLEGIHSLSFNGILVSNRLLLYPLSIIGIVWFINLYNFLDGIDAYASVEALFVAAGLYIFTGNNINLVLMASIIGFLFWNWPKAKIFMGDVGSTQLGFILVILGIYFHNKTDFNIFYWIMLSSLFWFDASFTLFRRLINREKLSQAHKKHVYQRIVQAGFSHAKTVYFSIAINAIILLLVFIAYKMKVLILPLLLINVLLLYGITRMVDKKKAFQ